MLAFCDVLSSLVDLKASKIKEGSNHSLSKQMVQQNVSELPPNSQKQFNFVKCPIGEPSTLGGIISPG